MIKAGRVGGECDPTVFICPSTAQILLSSGQGPGGWPAATKNKLPCKVVEKQRTWFYGSLCRKVRVMSDLRAEGE